MRNIVTDRQCWSYSVSFDAEKNKGDAYLDFRIRIGLNGKIEKVHILVIPIRDSHTAELMFNLVQGRIIYDCGPKWNLKLLSLATDGASRINGRLQGVVTRFEEESSPGCFLVWFEVHDIDLIIENIMKKFMIDASQDPAQKLVSHLRRESIFGLQCAPRFQPYQKLVKFHWDLRRPALFKLNSPSRAI